MSSNKTMEEKNQHPTGISVPGPIIIAPRIESMDVTIVMGDQRSSCMNFNGGEACVEDPYDDGLGDDEFEEEDYDGDGIKNEGVAKVMDEIDRSGCPECEFTDCVDHPMNRETQTRMKSSIRQLQDTLQPQDVQYPQGTRHPQGTQQPKDAQRSQGTQPQETHSMAAPSHNSKYTVTEGDAALEGMPEHFKSFIGLLRAAGLDVEMKKYERKEDPSNE